MFQQRIVPLQSLLYGFAEAERDYPRAVIGFTDITVRKLVERDRHPLPDGTLGVVLGDGREQEGVASSTRTSG